MVSSCKRLLLCLLLFTLSTGTASVALAGEALQRVNDFKTLRVGMSGNQPPMSMINRSGQPFGLDVDLARALAGSMQLQLDLQIIPFGDLMHALEKNQVDLVISGMSITPARTERVSFVGPYMMSGKSILTKKATFGEVDSSAAFDRSEVKLVALRNSTSADFVRNIAPNAQLSEVDDYDEGVKMLSEDKADAMVADMPMCILSVLRYPEAGFSTLDKPLTIEPLGIAVNKSDRQFKNLVENYLRALEKTGLLNKLRKKWFEDSDWLAQLPE